MKKNILVIILLTSIGFSANAQQVMNAVKQKTEVTLQKRLVKKKFGKDTLYVSYVSNYLSITPANFILN